MIRRTILWVDIHEEWPPGDTDVLLACADGVQQGARRGKTLRSYLRGDAPVFDATHWAALPTQPFDADCGQVPRFRSVAAGGSA